MKLWLVKRTDRDQIDFEEYKAVVVRAENANDAARIVCEERKLRGFRKDQSNATVERITVDGKRGVILAEFTGA
ncbi:hypothetical protein ABT282_08150 [Streptomyces sp. NPDC000927]|uniref:hypothetical protein n=1 Tax=Streptomyces sp. NPDC000927 TaxID=3154371 RepID=UPI00332A9079